MGNRIALPILGLLCCIVLLASGPVQAQPGPAQYSLSWYVVAGGGQMGMTGDGQTMGVTAGQTGIGWSEDGHGLGSGFWYGARWALVGVSRAIYLPLVIKGHTGP